MGVEEANERGEAAVKEAPLDHWIQWYTEHKRNELMCIASSDGRDVSASTKETGQPKADPCWLGLQRLRQFLVQERPVLLFDLNQRQQQCNARHSALQVLDSVAAAADKAREPVEKRLNEEKTIGVSTALIGTLREQSDKLNGALLFYLSAAPSESRPSHLAAFQEVLNESLKLQGGENGALSTVSGPSEGLKARNAEPDVASFLIHLESFLIQAMGEHAHRTQQGAATSSVAFLAEELDEPSPRALQEWLQAMQACISTESDSALGMSESALALHELSRTTAERTLTIRLALGERRDRAVADHDEARRQYLDVERQWNARCKAMSELRRDVEEQLAANCLVGGDGANPLLSRSLPRVRTADLAAAGDDVALGGASHSVTVRITDECLQFPTNPS